MTAERLYKEVLLDHFHHPRNRGDLEGASAVSRGRNPRCGDDVEVGIHVDGDRIDWARFRGRGCSVCIASASLMTEAVSGRSPAEADALCGAMQSWFGQGSGEGLGGPPPALEALSAVRAYPARRRCVLLSWEALRDALAAL